MSNIKYIRPVFCDDCATLALAKLEGVPLCHRCLMNAIGETPPGARHILSISPLGRQLEYADDYLAHAS